MDDEIRRLERGAVAGDPDSVRRWAELAPRSGVPSTPVGMGEALAQAAMPLADAASRHDAARGIALVVEAALSDAEMMAWATPPMRPWSDRSLIVLAVRDGGWLTAGASHGGPFAAPCDAWRELPGGGAWTWPTQRATASQPSVLAWASSAGPGRLRVPAAGVLLGWRLALAKAVRERVAAAVAAPTGYLSSPAFLDAERGWRTTPAGDMPPSGGAARRAFDLVVAVSPGRPAWSIAWAPVPASDFSGQGVVMAARRTLQEVRIGFGWVPRRDEQGPGGSFTSLPAVARPENAWPDLREVGIGPPMLKFEQPRFGAHEMALQRWWALTERGPTVALSEKEAEALAATAGMV